MKYRLGSLPLRLLTLLVLPLLLLLTLVAFGGVALHQAAMRDLVVGHNLQTVRGAAASLSEQLTQRHAVLEGLAERVADGEPTDSVIGETDDWLNILFDGGVAFYAADGELIAATPYAAEWAGAFSPPRTAGEDTPPFFPLIDTAHGLAQVIVTGRATGGGHGTETWAAGVVSLERLGLSDVLDSLHVSGSTTVYLITASGQILYHSDPAQVGRTVADTPYVQAALRGESGADYGTDPEGREIVASFAPVPVAGWALVQEERWKETISPLMRYSQTAPLILVPGLLIAAWVVWFGIQQIVYPLRELEARATDLAWGNFTTIDEPVGGIEEIRRLQATLRHMAARIQSVQSGMHSYIATITQAQEEERARLARELHDQTAQSLVALGHREQMLKRFLVDDPEAEALLSELRAMTTQAIDDLRRIIRAMRPIYLEELGLVPALKMLARDLNLDSEITVHFEQQGTPRRLPPEREIALYRVAQEALSNAWQHSKATQVWLSIRFNEQEVTLSVRDNGQGFAAPRHVTDLSERGHFGIMGMYERAALIGAHLQIRSEPGEGTHVLIRAPMNSAGEGASHS